MCKMIDRFERFSFAISEISRYWHKIAAEELKKYNLKSSHAVYLTAMYRFPDGITAPALADICGRDKADVSRMMSIMENKGLITKEGNGQNLYRGILKLTESGRLIAAQICKRASLAVERAGNGLTEENRTIFYECLERIAGNLKRISEEGL
ncbi:MAG: MarR family winged helix-turn-helix transcriptional regulator [Lachnospiraceae bacterium]